MVTLPAVSRAAKVSSGTTEEGVTEHHNTHTTTALPFPALTVVVMVGYLASSVPGSQGILWNY